MAGGAREPESAFVAAIVQREFDPIGRAIDEALHAGLRAYLLCDESFGGDASARAWMKDRQNRLFVRRMADPPADIFLVGRGRRGALLVGSTMLHELAPTGAEACFAAFLHFFWSEALEEAIAGKDGLRFRECTSAPFDTVTPPSPASDDTQRWSFASEPDQDRLVALRADALVVNPSEVAPADLTRLAADAVHMIGAEEELPAVRVNGEEAWIEARGRSRRLQIPIEPGSVAPDTVESRAQWRLQCGKRLRDLRGKVLLPGENEPRQAVRRQRLRAAPVVAANLFAMADAEPDGWPAPDSLALEVEYEWRVEPPRLPSGAKPDPLYSEWERCGKAFGERVAKCLKRVEREGDRSLLERHQVFVGFDQKRSELQQALRDLASRRPTTDPGDPVAELQAIEESIDELEQNQRRAVEEAKHDRKRQRAAERLKELRTKQSDVRTACDRVKQAEDELRERTASLSEDESVRLKKSGDERARLEKELRRIEHKIDAAKREADAGFRFEGSRKSGDGAFVPRAPKERPRAIAVPKDRLPVAGKLFARGGTRFLAVTTWEEAAAARRDAERLKARLVAPAGGSE
jgi:hypothetical protein